jgi:hypothetical protein
MIVVRRRCKRYTNLRQQFGPVCICMAASKILITMKGELHVTVYGRGDLYKRSGPDSGQSWLAQAATCSDLRTHKLRFTSSVY